MRLLKLQVQDFRSVEDSQEFSLSGVTCLVGKNESGKTALLKALHKLKPDEAAKESFDPARDYPRRKWRPDTLIPADPPAVSTAWELDDADMTALEEQFGTGAVRSRALTLTKGYDNVKRFRMEIDQEAMVKMLSADTDLADDDRKLLSESKTPDAAIKSLESVATRTSSQESLLKNLKQKFPNGGVAAVNDAIAERVPTFLYFGTKVGEDVLSTDPDTVSTECPASFRCSVATTCTLQQS